MKSTIDRLIINSPYEEPAQYWSYDRETRFFFCQLEAIETIIWLTEAPEAERVGIEILSDGGLFPSSAGNYYDEFNIVPPGLTEKLNQGKVLIKNWHALNWETEEWHWAVSKDPADIGKSLDIETIPYTSCIHDTQTL